MEKQGVFQYLKSVFKRNGMIGKLILINTVIFVVLGIISLATGGPAQQFSDGTWEDPKTIDIIAGYMSGPGDLNQLLRQPWSIFTQMFTHFKLTHFLFNMIALFFVSQIMVQLLGERRVLSTYILGGIFAYLSHVLMHYAFPETFGQAPGVVGASGAVYAIFVAVAMLRPKMTIYFFGLLKMPIIVLAVVYIGIDLLSVGASDRVAHFAHLGGALFGAISIINVNSPNNFMNRFEKFWSKFGRVFKRKPKMKLHKQEEVQQMDDDQYREEKVVNQERIDAILDKISKKGYEGLTKEEKEILFNESKRK